MRKITQALKGRKTRRQAKFAREKLRNLAKKLLAFLFVWSMLGAHITSNALSDVL
jgi:hypothetical protein